METEASTAPEQESGADLYCMAAGVVEEASRRGFSSFAKAMEQVLEKFLAELSREDQFRALQLSYEAMVEPEDAAPPRLRLAYSRD